VVLPDAGGGRCASQGPRLPVMAARRMRCWMVRAVIEGFAGAVGGARRREELGGGLGGSADAALGRTQARGRAAGEGLFELSSGSRRLLYVF
jgi:hypothetical protein